MRIFTCALHFTRILSNFHILMTVYILEEFSAAYFSSCRRVLFNRHDIFMVSVKKYILFVHNLKQNLRFVQIIHDHDIRICRCRFTFAELRFTTSRINCIRYPEYLRVNQNLFGNRTLTQFKRSAIISTCNRRDCNTFAIEISSQNTLFCVFIVRRTVKL